MIENNKFVERYAVFGVTVLLLLLYLFFPSHNSTLDAYAYASNVKWKVDIFQPHHLLYNITGYAFYTITGYFWQTDVLYFLKSLNAIFAFLCLVVAAVLLKEIGHKNFHVAGMLLFAGSSFGILRFATENETYIVPIFFSLLGSLYFVKLLKKECATRYILLSGFFASVACLYHQIHFFWWFGLLIGGFFILGRKRIKFAIVYVLPALVVPMVYFLVLVLFFDHSLLLEPHKFVLKDFYEGHVEMSFSLDHFSLTAINLVRTFVQVHGYMGSLLLENFVFSISLIASLALFIWAIVLLQKGPEPKMEEKGLFYTHFFILSMHVLFALYSVGNAEFMAMVPFLLVVMLASTNQVKQQAVATVALGILIWNFSFALYPLNRYDLKGTHYLVEIMYQHPEHLFILQDKTLLQNEYFYKYCSYPDNLVPPPSYYVKSGSFDPINKRIADAFKSHKPVFTDCVMNNRPMDRRILLHENVDAEYFSPYSFVPADSVPTISGSRKIYMLEAK